MRFLSRDESREWSIANGLNPKWNQSTRSLRSGAFLVANVDLEQNTFFPLPLAREIVKWLPNVERLLWVTNWGVWPSSEDQNLFRRLRTSYGEDRKLIDAPGHLFAAHEDESLVTFLYLSLCFGWDALLITSNGEFPFVFLSHDECMKIEANEIPGTIIQYFEENGKLLGIERVFA